MALQLGDRTYDSGKAEIRWNATAAALNKISFGDKLNTEMVRRIGTQEVGGITSGEYEPEDLSVTLEQAVWIGLLDRLPPNGYGNERFVITAFLSDPLIGNLSLVCTKCRIVGVKDSIEQGPGALMAELTIKTQQVVRNGKTLNTRIGVTSTGALRL